MVIMFVRLKKQPQSSKIAVQIVENYRVGNSIKQKVLRHVGSAMNDFELEALKKLAEYTKSRLECEEQPTLFSSEELAEIAISSRGNQEKEAELKVNLSDIREEQRIIVGIHEAYGKLYNEIGFDKSISSPSLHKSSCRNLFHMAMARIANPTSKRGSVLDLERNFGINISLDSIYRMMDKIDDNCIDNINKIAYNNARNLLNEEISVIFYDCTTLYFESFTEDELKENGYSKDLKFNQPQVLLALLTTTKGLPIGYEVYPGATFEGNTLIDAINNLEQKYNLKRFIFVADSGLLSKNNLEYIKSQNKEYIIGARIKNLSKDLTEKITDIDSYLTSDTDQFDKHKTVEYDECSNLLITYSSARAEKDRSDREKAIVKLQDKIQKSKSPASLISNYGYKKYLKIKGISKVELNKKKIEQAQIWDGLHGVITNIKDLEFNEIISHYHSLWQIEECFRISKHDLKIRPIYHWTPQKIKAHIAICFIALVCVRTYIYRHTILFGSISADRIKKELLSIQISILKDSKTQKTYALPSNFSKEASQIYKTLNLKLSSKPYLIQ
jgi:transposase